MMELLDTALNVSLDMGITEYVRTFFLSHFSTTQSVKFIKIAEFDIALHFAHSYIEEKYFAAFNHLEIPPTTQPSLDIFIFDLHSLGINQSLSEFVRNFFYQASQFKLNGQPRIADNHLFYFDEVAYYYNDRFKTALWIDSDTQKLGAPYWVHPLRSLLYDWLQYKGLQTAHTAAVSLNNQAALFCGDSGSGKSTLTVSCLMEGFNILGDDKCVVSLEDIPKVHSLYNTIKLFEKNVSDFHGFKAVPRLSIATPLGAKNIFYLDSLYQEKMTICDPIKVIFRLKINKNLKAPNLRLMTPSETTRHLAFSTIPICKSHPAQVLKNLHTLALKIPGYFLELSPHYGQNVELIKHVLNC